MLSETLTNAIVHGSGLLVEVDAYVGMAGIRIEVTDGGGGAVPHHRDDPHGEHGRGLPILGVLARSWGYEQLDDGRLRVWFEVPHTKGRSAAPAPSRHDGSRDEPSGPSAGTAHMADR
ncbi:hypothetical protein F8568_027330 [Actinomadura sp. LD22]|uniref:Histidine kinase/HSP90-like ATPase domain-containing protein n=1 Tax=Actinomadura physcomitrii TaxID=2650748 RepID=A0A6I4MCS4_9ACTN|nr:ATP-binding protein [Actinomadura physcomitrii]MWA04028.1 hypothetical protein [Actinomadura physcomitrii]